MIKNNIEQEKNRLKLRKSLIDKYGCDDTTKATHLFFGGKNKNNDVGKLFVPFDKIQEFNNDLYDNITNETILPPLNEWVNKKDFRFFMDIDNDVNDKKNCIEEKDFSNLQDNITSVIEQMFQMKDEYYNYSVWKNTHYNKYHILYNFKVNNKIATEICNHMDDKYKCFIDAGVYSKGLRMPYCEKGLDKKTKEQLEGVYHFFDGDKKQKSILENIDKMEFPVFNENYTIKIKKDKKNKKEILINSYRDSNDEIDFINGLLNIISIDKCNDYSEWCKIGLLLFNVNKDYLDIFKNWSKKSIKYEEGCCENKWKQFLEMTINYTGAKILLPSLIKMAKEDDYEKYIDLIKCPIVEKILNDLNDTDDAIANIFLMKYKNIYKFVDKTTYKFDNGLWIKLMSIDAIRHLFSNEIKHIYQRVLEVFCSYEKPTDIEELMRYNNTIEFINKIIRKLQQSTSITGILTQLKSYLMDSSFIEKLNTNMGIVSFGKDIFDLRKCEWRIAVPEDYCSFSTLINKEDVNDKYENEIHKLLDSIFPNTNEDRGRKEYMINFLTDCLTSNYKEIFNIWIGVGGNGKGVLADILKRSFGNYYTQQNVKMITEKKGASTGANPSLLNTKGRRIVMFAEPEANDKLNSSVIKELSGGDEVEARNLFESPVKFKTNWTGIVQCNQFELEDIKDNSMKRRLYLQKFTQKFVQEVKRPNEQLINDRLKTDLIPYIGGSFMYILLKNWTIRENKGSHVYEEPLIIQQERQKFVDDFNIVLTFLNKNYEYSDEKTSIISVADLYNDFKEYCEEEEGIKKIIKRKEFINRAIQEGYCFVEKKTVKGIKYRNSFINIIKKKEHIENSKNNNSFLTA